MYVIHVLRIYHIKASKFKKLKGIKRKERKDGEEAEPAPHYPSVIHALSLFSLTFAALHTHTRVRLLSADTSIYQYVCPDTHYCCQPWLPTNPPLPPSPPPSVFNKGHYLTGF